MNLKRQKKLCQRKMPQRLECEKEKILRRFIFLNERFREMYYIHSFSSVKENSFLWDTYTNNDEGFCIEYDIASIDKEIIQMLPILYTLIEDIKMDQ